MYTNWNRAEAKKRAKVALKNGSYGGGLGVCFAIFGISLLVGMVGSAITGVASVVGMKDLFLTYMDPLKAMTEQIGPTGEITPEGLFLFFEFMATLLPIIYIVVGITFIYNLLTRILILNPLKNGSAYWFLRNSETFGKPPVSMFHNFREGRYGKVVGGMFVRGFWLFVWGIPALLINVAAFVIGGLIINRMMPVLIFQAENPHTVLPQELAAGVAGDLFNLSLIAIIAGVFSLIWSIIMLIKYLSYSQTRFILADNPSIGANRAVTLSRRMMNGNKGKKFGLELSFIGYYILLLFTMVFIPIAYQFLLTYIEAARAEFYVFVRNAAVQNNIVSMEELGYVQVEGN